MARKRMIDPAFWEDEKIGALSPRARLTFIALWNFAEDTGVGRAKRVYLKNQIFSYDDLSLKEFEDIFKELVDQKLITLFTAQGQTYYFINNFKKHQYINRPTPSKLPVPPDSVSTHGGLTEDSRSVHNTLTADSHPKEKNIKEKNINQSKENKKEYGKFSNVLLLEREYFDLISTFGLEQTDELIDILSAYMAKTGKDYREHYPALLDWAPKNNITPLGERLATLEKQGWKKLYQED